MAFSISSADLQRVGIHLGQLEKELQCAICLCTLADPHSLPCSHQFCLECIDLSLRVKLECPLCKCHVYRRDVVKNRTFEQIIVSFQGLQQAFSSIERRESVVEKEPEIDHDENSSSSAFSQEIFADSPQIYEDQNNHPATPSPLPEALPTLGKRSRSLLGEALTTATLAKQRKLNPLCDINDANISNIFNQLKAPAIPPPHVSALPTPPLLPAAPPAPAPERRQSLSPSFVLVDTGLTTEEKLEFKKTVKGLGGTTTAKISENVTHLVTRRTNNSFKAPRTFKYLETILHGAWIVSYEWIEESSRAGKWLHEAEYEIQGDTSVGISDGPSRARIAINETEEDPIFTGLSFGLLGKFSKGIARNDLISLLKKGGATYVCRSLPSASLSFKGRFIVIFDKDLVPPESTDVLRRFQGSLKSLSASSREAIEIVNTDWLLDSLSRYSLQDISLYVPGPPPSS